MVHLERNIQLVYSGYIICKSNFVRWIEEIGWVKRVNMIRMNVDREVVQWGVEELDVL